ncbi:MAG: hypothetical protein KJI72_01475 [Patescibacteria group bacterium]|nr:hypothetical protein [Patescibacteria group bacterium]
MQLKTKYLNGLLIFLIVVAVVLGYAIYSQSPEKPELKAEISSLTPTPDESEVLNVPDLNASTEEKQRHFELVVQVAKTAEFLDISDCNPSPVVMKIKKGETIAVRNNDSADHSIVFNLESIHPIPAGSTKNITNVFDKGPGVYGYGCDASTGAVGMFLVTE